MVLGLTNITDICAIIKSLIYHDSAERCLGAQRDGQSDIILFYLRWIEFLGAILPSLPVVRIVKWSFNLYLTAFSQQGFRP